MNKYEGIFILKADFSDDQIKESCKKITDLVTKNGGSVTKEEDWGKRQLAYPVNKLTEGRYYKLDFDAPPDAITKMEAVYKMNADIVRAMITRR
jgi:small subunit ribosomal protein S6